jgi:hypothetical protein
MRNKLIGVLFMLAVGQTGMAQRSADTAAVIREFNDVLAFAVQPYLHYTSTISLHTGPMISASDTGNMLHGNFYKYGDDLYYGTEHEEMFLQDSLMIRVDHHRKTISVSKVDVATKKKMDLLPLKKMDRQRLLRDRYTISKMPEQGDTESIVIRSQPGRNMGQSAGAEMRMDYAKQGHLPFLLQVTMKVRERESPQVAGMMRTKGFDVGQMVEEQDGQRSLVMTQTARVCFLTLETTKEKAMQMPAWQEKISYDPVSGNYKGKGEWSGYEVVKTF